MDMQAQRSVPFKSKDGKLFGMEGGGREKYKETGAGGSIEVVRGIEEGEGGQGKIGGQGTTTPRGRQQFKPACALPNGAVDLVTGRLRQLQTPGRHTHMSQEPSCQTLGIAFSGETSIASPQSQVT